MVPYEALKRQAYEERRGRTTEGGKSLPLTEMRRTDFSYEELKKLAYAERIGTISSGTGTAAAGAGSGAGSAGQNGAVQGPRETKKNDISQQQEYAWQRKYAGKRSTDLQNIALGLDDGAEKKWVNGYAVYMDEEEKAAYDLEAGQAEIDAMEAKLAQLRRQRNVGYGTNNTHTGMTYGVLWKVNEEIDQQIEDLEAQIAAKKAYLTQAKYIQEGRALAAVAGNEDFSQYSGYVSTADAQGGGGDETYEWINNQNGYRERYEAEYENTHRNRSQGTSAGYGAIRQSGYDVPVTESEYEKKGYDHLNEQEIAIYNYYYATEGKEAAQRYLDSIQEELNQRKARAIYKGMAGNTAAQIVYGTAVGFDQFNSGIKSVFNFRDDYIPVSVDQYAGGMVREDLADAGPVLPEWMGGGSLGQMAYDVVTTSANMAPSILASAAVGLINPAAGKWVGNALMSGSAAGNAYQQALRDGYGKGEARVYSTMVGASELVMEKFVGGIEGFGGNAAGRFFVRNMGAADKALKMVAKQIGSMASEFTEEYLQTVLEPVLQNIILDTDHEVEFFSPEAVYAGVLGALTAAVMQGPSHVGGAVRATGSEKNPVAAGSEPSAAGGRRSEVSDYRRSGVQASNRPAGAALSESQWQRSKKSRESVSPKIFSGTATGRPVPYERTIGKEPSPEAVANRMAAVVSEDSGAFTMGRLFSEIGGELTRQNVSDITEALIEEGMDKRTARKNARILWYVVKNGPVSGAQAQMIEGNDILAKVMREVIIDPYCTVDPQSIGYNEILRRLARETVARESGYRLEMWDPDYAASAAGGGEGRTGLPGGGDNAAAAVFAHQGEGFGNGWQETRGAPTERNGANLEAAQGAGADALGAGSSFEQRQAENAAGADTTAEWLFADAEIRDSFSADARDRLTEIVKNGTIKLQKGFMCFPENDPLIENSKKVTPKEGFYDVAMHGSPTAVGFGTRKANMSPRLLANIIRHRADYHGEKIRLLSCSTGLRVDNGYCFAEELANALGVIVEAPDMELYIYQSGEYSVGLADEGNMIPYKPNERRRIKCKT